MEHNFKELPFLDIFIKKQNDQIIYHKPTDTQPISKVTTSKTT